MNCSLLEINSKCFCSFKQVFPVLITAEFLSMERKILFSISITLLGIPILFVQIDLVKLKSLCKKMSFESFFYTPCHTLKDIC